MILTTFFSARSQLLDTNFFNPVPVTTNNNFLFLFSSYKDHKTHFQPFYVTKFYVSHALSRGIILILLFSCFQTFITFSFACFRRETEMKSLHDETHISPENGFWLLFAVLTQLYEWNFFFLRLQRLR